MTERKFDDVPAVRRAVPLLIGLAGPSGGGKTGSALELAHGIQDITGGDIGAIDTESRRMLHYAEAQSFSDQKRKFKFNHLAFGAPFGPLDYMAAIDHYVKKGIKTIIIDSMSHEHEGVGGVLEMHEEEADRMAKAWNCSREKVTMTAWSKPKRERRELINYILQQNVNFIFCFRAKEKIKIVMGKNPVQLGWQPIAGEEYVFEQTLNCLLPPGANGVPEWEPEEKAERQMIKLPQQFKGILTPGRALSIQIGRELATWGAGGIKEEKPSTHPESFTIPQLNKPTETVMSMCEKIVKLIIANEDKIPQTWQDAARDKMNEPQVTVSELEKVYNSISDKVK